MATNPSHGGSQRLSELTRPQPGDRTLRNLLGTLNAQLEMCTRLPIYEYEATSEGHDASAIAFRELAGAERRAFQNLLASLRVHLDETARAAEQPERRPG